MKDWAKRNDITFIKDYENCKIADNFELFDFMEYAEKEYDNSK